MHGINFTLSDDFFEVKLYPTIRTIAAAAATLACGAFKTESRFSRKDIFARFRCVKVSSIRKESFLSESIEKQKAMLCGALMLLDVAVPYALQSSNASLFSSVPSLLLRRLSTYTTYSTARTLQLTVQRPPSKFQVIP